MTKIFNFALKIKGDGRESGTCEVLRPCHPPQNLKRAPNSMVPKLSDLYFLSLRHVLTKFYQH